MDIKAIDYDLSICKVSDEKDISGLSDFWFAAKTDEEISIVCKTDEVPDGVISSDDGWRAFRIEGVLDFSLIGILSDISSALAEAGIGIFAVSTFNTDYILTKASDFERALRVLEEGGYTIV